MKVQGASSTSSSTHWKYDVFISFRGQDTRKNFVDHLHTALKRKGLVIFKDDRGLEKGKSIAPKLSEAIEESRILTIVFSRNYASSSWCLDELVHIVKCSSENRQEVFPIFYDVDPSTVRKQTGSFQDAFTEHERKNIAKVPNWRKALTEVANLSGFHLNDRPESEFIQEICNKISKLIPTKFHSHEDLVGINSRLEELRTRISTTEFNEVQMIGIYGMGGIGKTTIARAVYDLISSEFECSCFLANVREISQRSGLLSLQKQLLSQVLGEVDIHLWDIYDGINMIRSMLRYKRVLIVIDDVDDIEQLINLVGKHNWFGLGSRVIITTRDKHLLMGVDKLYEAQPLSDDEAFELFSSQAFKNIEPSEEYTKLIKEVLKYAGGLPLAIQVLGSFLSDKALDEWESALKRLRSDSPKRIVDCLQISFDGLEETDKKIFLDIACFFKGKNKDHVIRILDGCSFNPIIGIRVLVYKCLLNISIDNTLWMHDLLQEMGKQIVKRESLGEPGKRSRLWEKESVQHILAKNMGTEAVESILLEEKLQLSVTSKVFSRMTKMRLLKICNLQLFKGLEYLPNELRLLDWHGYALKSLPSSFQLENLVELKLRHSHVEELWRGAKPINKLKVIDLSYSEKLKKTPDFTEVPNLEVLILEGCSSLCEIHPSLLVHQKLILLNLKDCTSLRTLESGIAIKSLEKLVLSGCLNLKKFLKIVSSMEGITELFLDGTSIKELPLSIELLTGLVLLSLEDCKNLVGLPSTINGLKSLKTLKLSGCLNLKKFPEIVSNMEGITKVFLDRTSIKELPLSFELLTGLVLLSLEDCKNLVSLPSTINGLKSLKTLKLSGCPKLKTLPENFGHLQRLEVLDISGTAARQSPSKSWCSYFPFSLMPGGNSGPMTLTLTSFSGLSSLKELNLRYCNLGVIPSDIGSLVSLKKLDLRGNNFVLLPTSINSLSKLSKLLLHDCQSLHSVSDLPSNLKFLGINDCTSLMTSSNASKLFFQHPGVWCTNRMKLPDYSGAISMPKIRVNNEKQFIIVPGSEIPTWVSHKSEGSSIGVKSCRDLKLMGYFVCAIFFVSKLQPGPRRLRHLSLCCKNVRIPGIGLDDATGEGWPDHLWLEYFPIDSCNQSRDWYDVEFNFRTVGDPGMEVKRCGAHPVYEHDIEKFDNAKDQCSSSIPGNLIEFHEQDFVAARMDVAEPSGSGNSDDDEPQPKRQKKLEFS